MMEKWLLKLSKYNKNTIDLIIGKKKKNTSLKYSHAAVREILFILTKMNSIYWKIKMLKCISFMN